MQNQKHNPHKWHVRFIELARLIASWSKDLSTKVGAVAVGPSREICSVGYNGLPRGVDDTIESRYERPAKYIWTEHAERNLVYNASRIGVSLQGCHLYCTHFPCPDCARGIIQSGISWLFYPQDLSEEARGFRERSHEAHLISLEMLLDAGIECRIIKGFDTQNFSIEVVQPVDLAP
jgi:dCMP deaminase